MILMLACATIGLGGDQDNNTQTNQEQNISQNENDNLQDQNNQEINNHQNDIDENNREENNNDQTEDQNEKPPETGVESSDDLWNTEFGALLASGDLVIEDVHATTDYETIGPILVIRVTNLSSDEIIVSVPCGLVFSPNDSDEQALMMIQPLEISLAAGETAEFTPFVVCIEVAAAAPEVNSGYTIGYLESEDLLTFAQCICGQQFDTSAESLDTVGIQFAAWTVATGDDLLSLAAEEDSSFQEFLDEMEASGMGDMISEMMTMFGSEWLDRCGITLEE